MNLFHKFFGDPMAHANRVKGEGPRELSLPCTVRNFDRFVLTPIFWLFTIAALAFLIGFHWLWLAGAVFGGFYTGTIGAKMHPKQSFSDLAGGPVTGPAAAREEAALTEFQQRLLLGHACTRVGILLGVTTGVVLWGAGFRWYLAFILGLVSLLFAGGMLKFLFTTER